MGSQSVSNPVEILMNERREPLRSRPARPSTLRAGVQLFTLVLILLIGLQFFLWVGHLERGEIGGTRPPGVEGFLPISALISLRHALLTGDFPTVHPAGLVILLLVSLTGLLLKKAFCSWLCPIGTLSEYLARFVHRVLKHRVRLPAWVDYPLMSLKYLLLAFFLHAIFFRMAPTDVAAFIDSPYNKVADIKMLYFFSHISPLALKIILGLVLLSLAVPYFWCRYLCPYGALLGTLSLGSALKVRRSIPDCTNCGRCAAVCPSFLKVDRKTVVSSAECTGCLECVANCPKSGAVYVTTPRLWPRTVTPIAFAILLLSLFYGGIGVAKMAGRWESNVSQHELQERVQRGLNGPEYGHFGR